MAFVVFFSFVLVEPLQYPLISSPSFFCKHASTLINAVQDGFIAIGKEVPGKNSVLKFKHFLGNQMSKGNIRKNFVCYQKKQNCSELHWNLNFGFNPKLSSSTICIFAEFFMQTEWNHGCLADCLLNVIWKDVNGFVKTAIEAGKWIHL